MACLQVPTDSNLSQFLQPLRQYLWDLDQSQYKYTDQWLLNSLASAINSLSPWWNQKYLLDENCNVTRNPNYVKIWKFEEPPVVEQDDEMPIILMASILIKSGVLQNNVWNVGTWRDAEIYYSNVEGGKAAIESLKRDWETLLYYLRPPTKKIAFKARKGKGVLLSGFRNDIEMDTKSEPWKDEGGN